MDCSCDYDGDAPDIWKFTKRKANKQHKCTDCGGVIKPGETYEYLFMVFEGDTSIDKRCPDCMFMVAEVGRTFFEECGGWQCAGYGWLDTSWDGVQGSVETVEEATECKRLTSMQNAVCEARGGDVKWHTTQHVEMLLEDAAHHNLKPNLNQKKPLGGK